MGPDRSPARTRLAPVIAIVLGGLLMIAPAVAASHNGPTRDPGGLSPIGPDDLDRDSIVDTWDEVSETLDDNGIPFTSTVGGTPVPDIVRTVGGVEPVPAPAERVDSSAAIASRSTVTQAPSDAGTRSTATESSDSPRVGAADAQHPAMAYALRLAAGIGLFLVPIAMYRRVKKSKALDNDVRNAIFKYVENNPGATITEIAEGVGVSHSTATYHIKILTEFDLVSKRRDGNSLHIFPSDAGLGSKEALLLSYMRDRETREIIRSVYANPWTYPSELARSLDMSRSSAQWHLEKLEDSGIVNVVRDGKFSYLYIEPDMKDTVEDHLVQ